MKELNKYILVWSLLLFFSCNSMKTVNLYDTVENKEKEDPFLSFPFKDIFTRSVGPLLIRPYFFFNLLLLQL